MKVVEKSAQNARNCTLLKKKLGGMPPNPPSHGSQLRCSRHAANGMYTVSIPHVYGEYTPCIQN